MSLTLALAAVAGLYGIAALVLLLGLFAAASGRMPGFLKDSDQPPAPPKARLGGLELVLLGLLMLLTALAYGGDARSERMLLVLLTWTGFSAVMLLLRMISRRVDRQTYMAERRKRLFSA
jgi:hypothetical protein